MTDKPSERDRERARGAWIRAINKHHGHFGPDAYDPFIKAVSHYIAAARAEGVKEERDTLNVALDAVEDAVQMCRRQLNDGPPAPEPSKEADDG